MLDLDASRARPRPSRAAALALAAAPTPARAGQPARDGWHARLDLRFAPRHGRTILAHAAHVGPLRVQRLFHPEGDGAAHAIVLHPPGGLVGGDTLTLDVTAEPGAVALLTTTGATKLYRSAGAEASQHITLRVAAGATVEHVPQPVVAFDGALGRLATHVDLAPGARFLGWEVTCLGRPAAAERLTHGAVHTTLTVFQNGLPLLVERMSFRGRDMALDAAWGLAGHPAFGTLVATHTPADAARAALAARPVPGCLAAATELGELLVVRVLGPDGEAARRALEPVRHAVRAAWGRAPHDPAIWRT
ncbi:MAG: urease accessory protein UreD [Deltaproteobacteria bacterium]|nr:urease accessory protein UreD [Deltaproteobacteria bacterium]